MKSLHTLFAYSTLAAVLFFGGIAGRGDDKTPSKPASDSTVEAYQYPKAKRYDKPTPLRVVDIPAQSAKFHTEDDFADVLAWYKKRFLARQMGNGLAKHTAGETTCVKVIHDAAFTEEKQRPLSIWVVTAKYVKPTGAHTVTVVLTRAKEEKTTDILVSVITDEVKEKK